MPVKLASNLPGQPEARIEIIPLIDIMFFLLAAFMLVSLSMVNPKSLAVDLPTATAATTDARREFVNVSVDKGGLVYLDRRPLGANELAAALATLVRTNAEVRVFVSGDRDARHGDVIRVLDVARAAGIQKVAFEVRGHETSAAPSSSRP